MARTRPVVAVALFCAAANAQSLQLSQTSLTFVGAAGGDSAPPQSIVVTSSSLAPVRFTVSTGGSKWLAVSPPVAVTPYRISVAVDPSALGAGAYQDRISIADSSGAYGAITVPVTFTAVVRQPALDVAPNSIR